MIKKLSALIISLGLIIPAFIQPSFAQTKPTLSPATSQELVDFLSEFNLTGCFTKSPEKTKRFITALEFSCVAMRSMGNKRMASFTAFRKFFNKGYYSQKVKKYNTLNKIQMMRAAMMSYGITIPNFIPDNQWKFEDIETNTTVFKAIKIGVFKPLSKTRTGIRLNKKTSRSDALGFLYKLSLIHSADASLFNEKKEKENQAIPFFFNVKQNDKLTSLEATINNIENKSYYRGKFKEQDAIYSAIKTIVNSLDDPYSEFYTPKENQQFFQGLKGDVEGIGAYIEKKENDLIIISPIKNSPAEAAGLQAGDIITHVNDESISGLTLQESVSKIKGPAGTTVNLKIKRGSETFDVQVTRKKITVPSITLKKQNGYYIVTLIQFNLNAAIQLKPILEEARQEQPKGIIIDLRNNPGGFLHVVNQILDFMLEKGKNTVQIQTLSDSTITKSEEDPIITDIPMAVIVNKGSASASEILAGTLQDYKKAIIVGQQSFGKGSVQEVISYPDGSALKITTAHWLTGKGNSIDKIGITPDVITRDNPGTPADESLDEAIRQLKKTSNRRSTLRR